MSHFFVPYHPASESYLIQVNEFTESLTYYKYYCILSLLSYVLIVMPLLISESILIRWFTTETVRYTDEFQTVSTGQTPQRFGSYPERQRYKRKIQNWTLYTVYGSREMRPGELSVRPRWTRSTASSERSELQNGSVQELSLVQRFLQARQSMHLHS